MKDKNISQVKLANAIGKHKTTINNWIKYDRIPPADFAYKIANYLNTDFSYIITGKQPNDEKKEIVFLKKNWDTNDLLSSTVKNLIMLDHDSLLMVNGYIEGKLKDIKFSSQNYISDNTDLEAAEKSSYSQDKE